jgi:TrmH family RNA methyltransferase
LKYISSKSNPLFKNISKLSTSNRKRKKSNSFIVEGISNIKLCIDNNFKVLELIICSEIISNKNLKSLEKFLTNFEMKDFSKSLFEEINYRKNQDGVIALIESKVNSIKNFKLSKKPYILIAESPEKPGNIGALLRTADAAGMDGLIIANSNTELYNPNTIRSSLGSLFTMQIAIDSTKNIIDFLKKNNITIYSTFVENSTNYLDINYNKSCAIVVGKESSSLSNSWKIESDCLVNIPMRGKMDSLNLSVCAAIVIFEGLKQRDGN